MTKQSDTYLEKPKGLKDHRRQLKCFMTELLSTSNRATRTLLWKGGASSPQSSLTETAGWTVTCTGPEPLLRSSWKLTRWYFTVKTVNDPKQTAKAININWSHPNRACHFSYWRKTLEQAGTEAGCSRGRGERLMVGNVAFHDLHGFLKSLIFFPIYFQSLKMDDCEKYGCEF